MASNLVRRAQFERALVHLPELFGTALRYARNEKDAEDLVQETFLRAYSCWDQFEQGSNLRAWLFRILTNSFINECRRLTKQRRWIDRTGPQIEAATPSAETSYLEPQLGDEVVAALKRLPGDFRVVVELADLKGLSYREIALRLKCPLGTVMSRLHRGRRILEAALGDYARREGILRAA